MNKSKFQTVSGIKIYPTEYLVNEELTDNDLNNLLDNNKEGLRYSLIIGMFKFINSSKRNYQIVKILKEDNHWYKKFKWSKEKYDEYEKLVIEVYKNIYQYKNTTAISLGQWFMTIYGLTVEGNTLDF